MSSRKQAIESWELNCYKEFLDAEEATNGVLLAKDRRAEFREHYGTFGCIDTAPFFGGNSSHACYWASEELLHYWEARPRTLWCQWAVAHGVANASEARQARRAASNQAAAIRQALQRLHSAKAA